MDTTLLLQSALAGTTNGFVYGLIGLGISVIFRGTRIINAMQGESALVGGVVSFLVLEKLGLPLYAAALGGVLGGGLLGYVAEVLLVRPTRRRGGSEESYLLLTLGIAFAISASVLFFFGRDSHILPGIGGEASVVFFDAAIRIHALWLIIISSLVMVLLWWFFNRTHLGLSMMASSLDEEGAATIGINVPRMRTLTFVLGGLMGGLAGVLVSPLITLHYEMGLLLTLKGFAAAILGGLANPFGAVVGGVTLGVIESVAVLSVSSGYKDVIAMSLLIVIMILMPHGMLGRGTRKGG
ncbi:MAG: branched-chain amino acid ABC transporter permease [Betaproteobacteria bacterium]|nr:branched-chain amino acid ABC transporter permease [Betaproteobacteria bacterium]